MTKIILLSKNQSTQIDDDDYRYLSQFSWHFNGRGYAARSVWKGGRRIEYMHRIIMKTPAGFHTDHINGDMLDNRKSNLRIATSSQNAANSKMRVDNTQGVKGAYVCKHAPNVWYSRIQVRGKDIYLGTFKNKLEAANAYKVAKVKYFGDFAKT